MISTLVLPIQYYIYNMYIIDIDLIILYYILMVLKYYLLSVSWLETTRENKRNDEWLALKKENNINTV